MVKLASVLMVLLIIGMISSSADGWTRSGRRRFRIRITFPPIPPIPSIPNPAPNPAPAPAPAVSPQAPAPAPVQVQAPGSPSPAPVPVPVKPQSPPSVIVPASPAQVLWASPAPSQVPMAVPVGFTVQSTVEAPGTFPGGNGQVEIQVKKSFYYSNSS